MKNFLIITNYYKDSEARLTNHIKEYIEKKGGSCSTFFSNGETPGEAAPQREDIPENYEGNVPLSYMIVTSDDQSDDGQSDEDQTEGDQVSDEEIDNVNDLKNYIDKIKLIIIIECESKETAASALKDLTKYLAAEKSSEEGSEMPDVPYYINEFEALLELFFNVQVVDNYYCIYTTSAYELISD